MKHKLTELKGEIDNSTIIVGNFNMSLLVTGRASNHKIIKDIEELNNTTNQFDLTFIENSNQ